MQNTEQLTQAQTLEFSNENVRVNVVKNPGCKVHMEVAVSPKAVEASYEKAFKEVKKEVSIPGFRKGKAPDDVIHKNYASFVEREWRDLCLQTAFNEGITLSKLQPLSRNSIKRSQLKKCTKNEGAEAVFEYEAFPSVPEVDAKTIETRTLAAKEVDQDQIEWELKKQQVRYATFEEIQDRPVQEGDYVELDLDVIENPAHNVFTSKLFCVTKDDMPKWTYDLVLGMQLNEAREGKASIEEHDECHEKHVHTSACNHTHEEPKLCRIICTAIKRGILPEVNDEFAQKFGLQSAQELKEKVKEMLEHQAKMQASEEARSKLAFELLQKYPVDLPRALIDSEVSARLHFVKKAEDAKHGSLPGQDDQALKQMIEEEVVNFFSCMYLLNNVAKDLPLQVTQDDLMQEITFETTALAPYQRLVYPGMAPEEARNRMYMRVMMRRKLDWLLSQNA